MNLNEAVIAVTGAGRGIGEAVALYLAERGASIAALDIDQATLINTVDALQGKGYNCRGYRCDVADEAQVTEVFGAIREDFGTLHGLVNNAGILRDAMLIKVENGRVVRKMSVAEFDQVVDVHMKGAFLCAREAAAIMVETAVSDGCIVNLSSGAFRGNFGQTNYSAAKAGIVAMTRVWAKELGRHGIRAMAIAPGAIDTDMLRSVPEHLRAAAAETIPLGRLGSVEHIAQTVAFILENDYLSGELIDVSGGVRV